jgi:hypothetical protein
MRNRKSLVPTGIELRLLGPPVFLVAVPTELSRLPIQKDPTLNTI